MNTCKNRASSILLKINSFHITLSNLGCFLKKSEKKKPYKEVGKFNTNSTPIITTETNILYLKYS
jgi:hypothetical protein